MKEREALIKSNFERSGVNGLKQIKPLTPFETRILSIMVPAVVGGVDEVDEMFVEGPVSK